MMNELGFFEAPADKLINAAHFLHIFKNQKTDPVGFRTSAGIVAEDDSFFVISLFPI